jgi:hypothetical protein
MLLLTMSFEMKSDNRMNEKELNKKKEWKGDKRIK